LPMASLLIRRWKRPYCSLQMASLFAAFKTSYCSCSCVPTTWKVLFHCTDLLNRQFFTSKRPVLDC
jgi:hypothetical protein